MLSLSSPLALVSDATHGCVSWADLLRSLGPHLDGHNAQEQGLVPGPGAGVGLGYGAVEEVEEQEEEDDEEVVGGVNVVGGDDDEEGEEEEEDEDGSDEGFADVPTPSQSPGQGRLPEPRLAQELGPGPGLGLVDNTESPDKPPASSSSPPLGPDLSPIPDPSPSIGSDASPGPKASPGMLARIANTLSWSSQSQSSPQSPLTTTALATHNTDLPPRPALRPAHQNSYNTVADSENPSNLDLSNHDQSNLNDRASVGSRGSQVCPYVLILTPMLTYPIHITLSTIFYLC